MTDGRLGAETVEILYNVDPDGRLGAVTVEVLYAEPSGFTGTATPTQAADTATAAGTVTDPPTTGTVAALQSGDTANATGSVSATAGSYFGILYR